jgi:hypothetical protein
MSVQETIAPPALARGAADAEPFSEAWWHDRSAEELRSYMSRGPASGAAFDAATAEVERRARERLRNEEQAEATKDTRNQRMRRLILEGLLFACLLIVIAVAATR